MNLIRKHRSRRYKGALSLSALMVCFFTPMLLLGQLGLLDVLDTSRKIFLVVVGFGSVIYFHELGHFLSAKYFGIRCDVFSLGIGPRLCGWRKGLGFTFGSAQIGPLAEAPAADGQTPVLRRDVGETDYRISWLPFGGYVRMLGQDDMDPTKASDDPASFTKKPIWQRMVVISSGVFMNLYFAVFIFAIVFRAGVDFPPAVVGGLEYNSPAQKAGLQVGDRIVSINHQAPLGFLEFMDLGAAAALDNRAEPISLQYLRDNDPIIHNVNIVPMENPQTHLLAFGIVPANSLTISDIDPDVFKALSQEYPEFKNIIPGSKIRKANGLAVNDWGQLYAVVQNCQGKPVQLELSYPDQPDKLYTLVINPTLEPLAGVDELPALLEMYPPVRLQYVSPDGAGAAGGLQTGDVILRAGTINYPDINQLLQTIQNNAGQSINLEVLRQSKSLSPNVVTLHVTPQKSDGKGFLDVAPVYDFTNATVGHLTPNGVLLGIQPGAKPIGIGSAVDEGELKNSYRPGFSPIGNWFDLVNKMQSYSADQVVLYFDRGPPILMPLTSERKAAFDQVEYVLPNLPVNQLEQLQRAGNVGTAIQMGLNHTWSWILRTYLTLRGLGTGTISPSQLHSIVVIADVTYQAESLGFMYMLFLLGVISVNLAVINFLPLPILDGGLFVLLIIEKIRGRPLSLKVQAAIQLVGIILIVSLFLYITVFNDLPMVFH